MKWTSGQLLSNHGIYYCRALLPPNGNIELRSTRTFVFHSPLFIWLAKHCKTSIIKSGSSKSLALLDIQRHIYNQSNLYCLPRYTSVFLVPSDVNKSNKNLLDYCSQLHLAAWQLSIVTDNLHLSTDHPLLNASRFFIWQVNLRGLPTT